MNLEFIFLLGGLFKSCKDKSLLIDVNLPCTAAQAALKQAAILGRQNRLILGRSMARPLLC